MWLDAALQSERAQEERERERERERGKREKRDTNPSDFERTEQNSRRHLHIFADSVLPGRDKLIKSSHGDARRTNRTRNVRKYDINLRRRANGDDQGDEDDDACS